MLEERGDRHRPDEARRRGAGQQPERQREELGTVALVVLILGGVLLVGAFILMVVGFAALASMGR